MRKLATLAQVNTVRIGMAEIQVAPTTSMVTQDDIWEIDIQGDSIEIVTTDDEQRITPLPDMTSTDYNHFYVNTRGNYIYVSADGQLVLDSEIIGKEGPVKLLNAIRFSDRTATQIFLNGSEYICRKPNVSTFTKIRCLNSSWEVRALLPRIKNICIEDNTVSMDEVQFPVHVSKQTMIHFKGATYFTNGWGPLEFDLLNPETMLPEIQSLCASATLSTTTKKDRYSIVTIENNIVTVDDETLWEPAPTHRVLVYENKLLYGVEEVI